MLSIIIVNFKNPPLLRLCLKSLAGTIEKGFEHEIIVVDIASTVETRNTVHEFPEARLLPFKENIGYTKGTNEGIKISQGDAFLILNSDVIPLKGSIEVMYRYLKDNPDIGILGPQLLNFDGSIQNSSFRFPSPSTLLYRRTFLGRLPFGSKNLDRFTIKGKDGSEPYPADWLMGSAVMVSKKAIDQVGLMDENLFLYMSDVDWPKRFWENGYKVIHYPHAKMYHYHKRESKGQFIFTDLLLRKETRWHLIDAWHYFRKHGTNRRTFIS